MMEAVGAGQWAEAVERKVADRNEQELVDRLDRTLTVGVETAERLDRVADELQPQRQGFARGEDVENAAAEAELAVLVDGVLPLVAAVGEDRDQQLRRNCPARGESSPKSA